MSLRVQGSAAVASQPARPASGSLEALSEAIARGEEVAIAVSYNVGVFGNPVLSTGQVTISRSSVGFRPTTGGDDFKVAPDKIIDLASLPIDSSKDGFFSPIQSAPCIRLKVAVKDRNGDKERKKDLRFYNSGARVLEHVQWAGYAGINIVDCTGCDDSLNVLYALLEKVRQKS